MTVAGGPVGVPRYQYPWVKGTCYSLRRVKHEDAWLSVAGVYMYS